MVSFIPVFTPHCLGMSLGPWRWSLPWALWTLVPILWLRRIIHPMNGIGWESGTFEGLAPFLVPALILCAVCACSRLGDTGWWLVLGL